MNKPSYRFNFNKLLCIHLTLCQHIVTYTRITFHSSYKCLFRVLYEQKRFFKMNLSNKQLRIFICFLCNKYKLHNFNFDKQIFSTLYYNKQFENNYILFIK